VHFGHNPTDLGAVDMSDPTFTLGELLQIGQIISIIGGGLAVAIGIARYSGRVESNMKLQATEIQALQDEILPILRAPCRSRHRSISRSRFRACTTSATRSRISRSSIR
jgi:hypothetical protein